jgi:hypothetical protein
MLASRMHARAVPPADGQNSFLVWLEDVVAAAVFTVRVVVSAVAPLIVIEAGTLHVAGSLAASGVIAQLRLIAPVNPFEGVKVMVEVLPVVSPGATVRAVPATEKLGAGRLMVYVALATALAV